ncbi:MAG: hypothetical protein WBL40_14040, partial [Terrimicrobiaceae bacterium]
DVAHKVRNLDVGQAVPESSGYFERPCVNVPIEITRRLSESDKIAQWHSVRPPEAKQVAMIILYSPFYVVH